MRERAWMDTVLCYLTFCTIVSICKSIRFDRRTETCEPINIDMCQTMPYNMTRMPNLLHHSTQENARLAIEQYQILLNQSCSDDLLFFLCAMYTPICAMEFQPEAIPPCQGVCEKARAGCEPIMNEHNVSWPEALDCSLLPRYDRGVCVNPDAIVSYLPEGCKCGKAQKPSRKKYLKGKYHYALRGRVKSSYTVDGSNTVTVVTVEKVLKGGVVPIPENTEVELWTNSSCVCPALSKNKDYFIVGMESNVNNKLLLLENTLVARWRDKWEKSFINWEKKGRRRKGKGKGNKKRKNRKKNKRKNKKNKKDKKESESTDNVEDNTNDNRNPSKGRKHRHQKDKERRKGRKRSRQETRDSKTTP